MNVAITPQQAKLTSLSAFGTYREMAVGNQSNWALLRYELFTLMLSNLAGIVGFGARSLIYPYMFSDCGKRPAFGKGLIIKGPGSIVLGNRVLIDDYAALDAKGEGASIELGDCVSIGRYSIVSAKSAHIKLHKGVNISSQCRIASQSKVEIGESTLIAAYVYIGPGNHQKGNGDKPLIEREMEIKGGVKIGAHCWIGAHSTIMDGVKIGDGAIVGAHSFVKDDVPAGATAIGCPARIVT